MKFGATTVTWMRRRLLGWGRAHFRKYPWRQDRDLYRSLVTEILLKQTQADRVAPIRENLLAQYPTPAELARARVTEIQALIHSLGFASQRAGHLKGLGQELDTESAPKSADELATLPGIGNYSAAASACFVFGQHEIALDVNVARIISRVFGLAIERGELRKSRRIREIGRSMVNGPRPREVNWALLDLGALVCRPRPRCEQCPLQLRCSFAIQQRYGVSGGRLC